MEIYTIYKVTNCVNNKVYIGFTSNWPQRINSHKYDQRYDKNNKAFYNALKKYGWESFVWEAIYQSVDYEHTLKIMEPHFINEYRSWVRFSDSNGYNTTRGGDGTRGWKRSQELIESHKQQMTGRQQTPEHVAKRVKKGIETKEQKGILHNPAWTKETHPASAQKVSVALQGKPKTEKHKQSMRTRPQDTKMLQCPHCHIFGDYKNMKRWHMDRCKNNPNRIKDLEKTVTCNVCNYSTKQTPNFYRNHNNNCKSLVN